MYERSSLKRSDLSRAAARLCSYRRAANHRVGCSKQFWRALIEDGNSDARFYVDRLIETHFYEARRSRMDKIHNLMGIMTSFVAACNLAGKEMAPGTNAEHRLGGC